MKKLGIVICAVLLSSAVFSQVEKEVLQLIKQFHDGGLLVIPDQNATPNVEFKK